MAATERRRSGPRTTRILAGVVAAVLVVALAVLAYTSWDRSPTVTTASFCRHLNNTQSAVGVLGTGDAQQISDALGQLTSLVGQAPDTIKPQVQTLAAYAQQLAGSVTTATDADAALADTIRRLQDQQAAVEQAGKALQAYARDTCGVDLDTGATTPTTAPAG